VPNVNWTRPELYPAQENALFCPERYAIVEASTKAGKTVGAMTWLIEQALTTGKPNRHYWWVAPIYRQAKIAYNRFKTGLTQGTFTKNDTDLTITIPFNGAILEFKGADDPNSLYGEDVYAAVMDEFTRAKEEAWHALRSTITQTGASVRFIGNVKGRGNWGYKLARKAESGTKNWKYSKITAYDAAKYGIIPLEEIEDAKSVLPEHVFKELYLCIPADDGGNPFGLDAIADCVGPLSEKPPKLMGVDLGKAQDYTAIIGLDEDNVVCVFERFQRPWKQSITDIVSIVGGTPCMVDSTGLGDPILEELQSHNPRVYEGFKYSGVSKQQLMEGLALVIQQRRITFPEGVIRNELETFEYEYSRTGIKYSAPSGLHDDTVNALALAAWKTVHRPKIHTQNRTAVSEMRDILQTYVPR
jgi:hypothetical protein